MQDEIRFRTRMKLVPVSYKHPLNYKKENPYLQASISILQVVDQVLLKHPHPWL